MPQGQTSHAIPGRRPVAEALRARRRLRELHVEQGSGDDLRTLAEDARAQRVRVVQASREELDALAGGVRHQGVVALAPPFAYRSLDELPADADLVVVLDGVTDPQNLGSIARSAEQAGAGALIVPRRRSAHVTPAVERAAAGALSWLPVVVTPNVARALERLTDHGFWSVGLVGGSAQPLWSSPLLDGKVALVVGAEGAGLSRLVAERVDGHIGIPMVGHLDSLNAGVASGIALFEVRRRRSSQHRAQNAQSGAQTGQD